jgi:ATP-dependent Lon protease
VLLPLFPLPNVVHFPGTRLSLHIFEPRYRQMLLDLLARPAEERRIGMLLVARPLEGGEPEILEPGCAGKVIRHDPLPDGRSNIVLEGEFRFAIEEELPGLAYRRAWVRRLDETMPLLDAERAESVHRELSALLVRLARAAGDNAPVAARELAGFADPRSLPALANQLASRLDVPALRKQSLLADPPLARAEELAGILRARLRLLDALAPYRHLASAAAQN